MEDAVDNLLKREYRDAGYRMERVYQMLNQPLVPEGTQVSVDELPDGSAFYDPRIGFGYKAGEGLRTFGWKEVSTNTLAYRKTRRIFYATPVSRECFPDTVTAFPSGYTSQIQSHVAAAVNSQDRQGIHYDVSDVCAYGGDIAGNPMLMYALARNPHLSDKEADSINRRLARRPNDPASTLIHNELARHHNLTPTPQ